MPRLTKAETSFNAKLQHLLGPGRAKPDPGPVRCIDQDAADRLAREQSRPLPLDTGAVASLFAQLGTYLELVGEEGPAPERFHLVWPRWSDEARAEREAADEARAGRDAAKARLVASLEARGPAERSSAAGLDGEEAADMV